ncbi:MAG: hypothetical protein E7K04_04195 [Helicobacter sp.]|nr:hypothetical protein [Helicobacter sp.]
MSQKSSNPPFFMPTPYFGISLGTSAFTLAWLHLGRVMPSPALNIIGNILSVLSIAIFVIFALIFIYRLFKDQEGLSDEYHCPTRFSFFALIFISTMLLGDILVLRGFFIGDILIWAGSIGGALFSIIRIGYLWRGDCFIQGATLPPFYLPVVAMNFTSASSLALLGFGDLGYLFLGAGMIAWIIYEPVLLQNLRLNATPDPLKPTFGIILAPAFVGSSAYLSINGGEIDLFVKLLWGYGFLQAFFLLRLLGFVYKPGFNMGFWGFSFGLATMANSAIFFYTAGVLTPLAIIAFVFANACFIILLLWTLLRILQGKFWLKS